MHLNSAECILMDDINRALRRIIANRRLTWMILFALGLFFIGSAVIIFLVNAGKDSSNLDAYSARPIEVNFPAPQITLTDLTSKTVNLTDFKGEIMLVNNWATWCPPCKAEMPTLQKYFKDHSKQGFVIVAIESGESPSEVLDFVKQNSIEFPVWIDIQGLALEKFKNWDLPSSYIIDRSGTVRLTWTGPINLKMLEKYVTPLLLDE